jgi:hypothetical protein
VDPKGIQCSGHGGPNTEEKYEIRDRTLLGDFFVYQSRICV